MAKRPRMLKIDDDMQRWCGTLVGELSAWPRVTSRPMFGLVGFYRGKSIFAAIPRTRAIRTANALLLKLPADRQQRLKAAGGPGPDWVTFEMHSPDDIPEALRWLQRAYEQASPRPGAKK